MAVAGAHAPGAAPEPQSLSDWQILKVAHDAAHAVPVNPLTVE